MSSAITPERVEEIRRKVISGPGDADGPWAWLDELLRYIDQLVCEQHAFCVCDDGACARCRNGQECWTPAGVYGPRGKGKYGIRSEDTLLPWPCPACKRVFGRRDG